MLSNITLFPFAICWSAVLLERPKFYWVKLRFGATQADKVMLLCRIMARYAMVLYRT
jgi:hypothetical protein